MAKLTRAQAQMLQRLIRVDQAGELGANVIYQGQYFVMKRDKKSGPVIKHMWEQEVNHLTRFNALAAKHRVRPTLLTPIWQCAGLALGSCTALLGTKAAMACTEAVETVIGEHYNNQLRELLSIEGAEMEDLRETVRQFRDEELEHLDTAVEWDSHEAPAYPVLTQLIKSGCKSAIWLSQRV